MSHTAPLLPWAGKCERLGPLNDQAALHRSVSDACTGVEEDSACGPWFLVR